MKALRHEVYICSDIETDAAEVQEKLRQAELAAQEERNEVKQDKHNLNIIVIGGSGSGKTRFYVKPNALQLIGSYLFLDPKGELTRTLGRIMEMKGISVTVLDLVQDRKSVV